MAVLDGKYEILAQMALSDMQTQFDAVAPDGRSLRIVWYDLANVAQEARFERYRKVLRRLRRADLAALHDIVSRPGAHYVAWYAPDKASLVKAPRDLKDVLEEHDYVPESADIRVTKGARPLVYDLAFDPEEPLKPPIRPAPPEPVVVPSLSGRLPRIRLNSWGLSAALLLASAALGLASFQISSNAAAVQVPDVLGQDVNEAARALQIRKLAVEARAVPSEQPVGEVLSVSPSPGTMLKPYYRTVRLSYAAPSDVVGQVQVPDLSALRSVDEVREALSEVGLELGQTLYTHANATTGTLISQTPSPNSSTPEGSTVDILLSEGAPSQLTLMPDLVGQTVEDAQFLVGIAGLRTPVVETITSPSAAPNTVVEQTVAPYRIVPTDDTLLRLYIAAPNEEGERVPALIGLSQREAQTVARGFELTYLTLDTPDLPSGVVNQSPAPGSVREGSALELTINTYLPKRPIPVPDASAEVSRPEPRTLRYAWPIERGIREIPYEVKVTNNRGRTYTIQSGRVTGGERVEGEFRTAQYGPFTFELFLQDTQFSIPLIRD